MAAAPAWRCEECDLNCTQHRGWLDFLEDVAVHNLGNPAQRMMHRRLFAQVYEAAWRPFFVSVAGGRRADVELELAWIFEQVRHAEGGEVLDLSCGPGLVGRRLAKSRRFRRVIGLDHARQMLELCLDHCAPESVADFDLVRADAAALPFGDASLDAVHAGAALHIWSDIPGVLAEVARVLRPGGVFVASTFVEKKGWRQASGRVCGGLLGAKVFARGELKERCETAGLVDYAKRTDESMIWLRAQRPERD